MNEQFTRTALLIGEENLQKLSRSSVAIFGIGGVGSFVIEALARSGIGALTIVDDDTVSLSNLNRQLIALHSTVGLPKTEVMRQRILDINPHAQVTARDCFYTAENAGSFPYSDYDYIIDAIDTVSSKLLLIEHAKAKNVPIISCMGTGNKFDPTRFRIADIYKTSVCPLARVMRRELKKRSVQSLKVLYSEEIPCQPDVSFPNAENTAHQKRQTPGSMPFVPPVAGMILAGEVINDLLQKKDG